MLANYLKHPLIGENWCETCYYWSTTALCCEEDKQDDERTIWSGLGLERFSPRVARLGSSVRTTTTTENILLHFRAIIYQRECGIETTVIRLIIAERDEPPGPQCYMRKFA